MKRKLATSHFNFKSPPAINHAMYEDWQAPVLLEKMNQKPKERVFSRQGGPSGNPWKKKSIHKVKEHKM
jgi:hypothetical protein